MEMNTLQETISQVHIQECFKRVVFIFNDNSCPVVSFFHQRYDIPRMDFNWLATLDLDHLCSSFFSQKQWIFVICHSEDDGDRDEAGVGMSVGWFWVWGRQGSDF
eukprot:TRINITY_DN13957_c0_g2_i1.p1 TRINITY_DN13957_c0_g2~~TRINITY_DN13957_c0_g2_i1.p1  ORF type:complete len:105 (+),score=14.50 TRINITY_DN13957_c0_g2_i1:2-316(+)